MSGWQDGFKGLAVSGVVQKGFGRNADTRPLTQREADAFNKAFGPKVFELETPSQPKDKHWTDRAERRKGQRGRTARVFRRWLEMEGPKLIVTVWRVSPRLLDKPNLGEALKSVVDGMADAMLLNDRSPIVEWDLQQRKGSPARIEWSCRWVDADKPGADARCFK